MLSMHPGEYLEMVYLDGFGMKVGELASKLGVSASSVSRLVNQKSDLSPNMAMRLSYVVGQSSEFWMSMQSRYSLAQEMEKFSAEELGLKKAC
jgi:addiction module HigA family antidote